MKGYELKFIEAGDASFYALRVVLDDAGSYKHTLMLIDLDQINNLADAFADAAASLHTSREQAA